MKRKQNRLSLVLVLLLTITQFACQNDKVSVLSPAQQKLKLDSLLQAQKTELIEAEAQKLRDRISIEKKVMVDSLLNSRIKNNPPPEVNIPSPEIIGTSLQSDTL